MVLSGVGNGGLMDYCCETVTTIAPTDILTLMETHSGMERTIGQRVVATCCEFNDHHTFVTELTTVHALMNDMEVRTCSNVRITTWSVV